MNQLTSWQQLWDRAQPILGNAEQSLASTVSPTPRILRVGQLDSELLDVELVNILRDPLSKALGLVNVYQSLFCAAELRLIRRVHTQSTLKSRFEPELSLFIQLTLYRLSVWANGASYGAKLQDLEYTIASADGRSICASHLPSVSSFFLHSNVPEASRLPQKILLVYGALTIILPYVHTRLRGHALSKAWPDAPSSDRRRKAWELMTRLETAHAAVALVSFVAFLWDGQ